MTLPADSDPADENSVISIMGPDADAQMVPYFDVDQAGGTFYALLDPTAQWFMRMCVGQASPPFRIVDTPGGVTQFQVSAAGVVTTHGGVIFPTSDPLVAGAWWDNAGTLTRSSG